MTATRPWTDADDQTLRDLHAASRSLHSIAKEMGRSKSVIHRKAEALGLSWDRTDTANAARAVAVDNKARRARAIARMYDRIEHVQNRLDAATFQTTLKGEGARDERVALDFVPTPDERNLADTISRYVASATKLEAVDSGDQDTSAVGGWLKAMLGR